MSRNHNFRKHAFWAATLCCTALTACASIATELPEISLPDLRTQQVVQETLAFSEIERLHSRLVRVAAPILEHNTALCPKTRRGIGVTTHRLKDYPKAMRDAAAREIGAAETPTIRRVITGSPADKAGLKAGDQIISWDGKALSVGSKDLRALLANDEAELMIKRGSQRFTVTVNPREMCDYKIKLSMRSTINAYANGRSITVTSGMMNFTQSDEELALIIAHELAHNTMGHVRKIVGNTILSGFAKRFTRPFESEADYVGLYYAVRAGYSPDNIEQLWKRMALIGPRSVSRAASHPTYPDRYLRLAAARAEIAQKQAAGEALVPNFKDTNKK